MNHTNLETECTYCKGTGMVYNEGNYGWDYGGYFFCDCEVGKQEEAAMKEAYEKS